jgi:hypothetical protein
MTTYDNKILLDAREVNPIVTADGSGFAYARGNKYGELVVRDFDEEFAAIEGSWGVFANATPGTGITMGASITAYDATKDALHILNGETSKRLVIKYIRFFVGTVPGGSGTQKYEILVDTQTGYTSGGTALTKKRTNLAVASTLGNVTATMGALTTVAASANAVRGVYSGELRNGVGLAGDTFWLTFGRIPSPGGFLLPATTVGEQRLLPHGPLVIAPGGACRLSLYGASLSTAAVYEVEIGCYVR